MGKLHNIVSPTQLKKLKNREKALQKEMTRHISNDPMLREAVKLNAKVAKHLRQKLKI
jgi:hypothetical protein